MTMRLNKRTLAAAMTATRAWAGSDKLFIASVHAAYISQGGTAGLADFKAALIELHQAGAVTLVRADLVEAMDIALVRASHCTMTGLADFHFIRR